MITYAQTPSIVSQEEIEWDLAQTNRYKEDSSINIHASQSSDYSATPEQKLTTNQDVRNEGKGHEHQVRNSAVPGIDDFEVGMASRRILFDFASKNGEDKDLYGRSCRIPERSCNTVCVRNLS